MEAWLVRVRSLAPAIELVVYFPLVLRLLTRNNKHQHRSKAKTAEIRRFFTLHCFPQIYFYLESAGIVPWICAVMIL